MTCCPWHHRRYHVGPSSALFARSSGPTFLLHISSFFTYCAGRETDCSSNCCRWCVHSRGTISTGRLTPFHLILPCWTTQTRPTFAQGLEITTGAAFTKYGRFFVLVTTWWAVFFTHAISYALQCTNAIAFVKLLKIYSTHRLHTTGWVIGIDVVSSGVTQSFTH